jgi:heptosyltransferase-2
LRNSDTPAAGPILVIRFSSLGDIILTEPATRALREGFPRSRIHYLTKSVYGGIVGRFEAVDRVVAYDEESGLAGLLATGRGLGKRSYRIVIDLHGSLRSRFIRLLLPGVPSRTIRKNRLGRLLLVRFRIGKGGTWPTAVERSLACLPAGSAGAGVDRTPRIDLPEPVRTEAKRILAGGRPPSPEHPAGRIPILALAPGSRWQTKRWPADRFSELGRRFTLRFAVRIVVLGGTGDRPLCEEVARGIGSEAVSVAGRTSLEQAAGILEVSSLLITNDTGLLHLATAVGTPSLAIFGPTTRELGFFPPSNVSRVLELELPCRPCSTIGSRSCPIGTHECMLGIPVDRAFEEAVSLFEREG